MGWGQWGRWVCQTLHSTVQPRKTGARKTQEVKTLVAASPADSEHAKGLVKNNSLNPQKPYSFNSLNKSLTIALVKFISIQLQKLSQKPPNPLGTNKPNMNHQLIVWDMARIKWHLVRHKCGATKNSPRYRICNPISDLCLISGPSWELMSVSTATNIWPSDNSAEICENFMINH